MKKILLVEDDPILGKGVQVNVELEGYQCTWVKNLTAAREEAVTHSYHLILLDLGLPDGSGLDFCLEFKKLGIPIIILTAQTDEQTVVEGFQNGATDYVKKPFSTRELHVRIKAHLKEFRNEHQVLCFGDLKVDLDTRVASWQGQPFPLNRRKFDLLCYLMKHAEIVIDRESLLGVLGIEDNVIDRTIDAHISQLRSDLKKMKIKNIKITSVYGVGYRLEKL